MPWVYQKNKNKSVKSKRKKHFSDYIVYISIMMIVGYTVAAFILQFIGLMEVSSTLTGCWYSFWTVEIITLATIKNTKTKNQKEGKKDENYTENYSESER